MSTRMMFICRACGEQTNTTDPPAVAKCGKCGKVHYTPEQAKLIENVLAALTTCPQCGKDHEIGDRCELETFIDWVLRKLEEMASNANKRREARGMLAWDEPVMFMGGPVGEA